LVDGCFSLDPGTGLPHTLNEFTKALTMISTSVDRHFSTPFSLLLGLVWLFGAAGAGLALWAGGALAYLGQSMASATQTWALPLELSVRQTPVHFFTSISWTLTGLALGLASMALAVLLVARHDADH
jgi:hypothetical protein